ncbi:unnamed protein product [Symbiodinium natans]|uniref:Uncharacterized protein n=1 Tax=Symbiodinium natans TaxID=878477 RepID=A0A812UTX2_9DINO|nr:unnamed protein product [Symbiodinium natans]
MEEDQETMTCHFMSEPVCYAAGSQLLVSSRILAVVLPLPLSGFALQPFWLRLRQLSSVGRVLWEKMDMGGGVAEYHVHVDGVTECHVHVDDDTFLCCPIPDDTNLAGVVMTHRLERLHELSLKNFHLAICCLIYIAVNMACLVMNSMGEEWLGVGSRELTFHLVEFWATFVFSCVQVYSLVYSPRSVGAIYRNPLVLKTVIFLNVASTFFSALLVSVSLESFEVLSHEIEYSNEITMAFVDVVLLGVVARQAGYNIDRAGFTLLTTLLTLVVAVAQLGIYNMLDGPNGGRWGV